MEMFINVLVGFVCVTIHCLFKANSLKSDFEAGGKTFTLRNYISKDYLGVITSYLTVILWLLIYQEIIAWVVHTKDGEVNEYGKYSTLVRVSFGIVGFLGSYFLQLFLSRAKKTLRKDVIPNASV